MSRNHQELYYKGETKKKRKGDTDFSKFFFFIKPNLDVSETFPEMIADE